MKRFHQGVFGLCLLGIGMPLGCVKQAPPQVAPPTVAEAVAEPVSPPEPVLTPAEREALSYELGRHWWVPERARQGAVGTDTSRLKRMTSEAAPGLAIKKPKSGNVGALASHIRGAWEDHGFRVAAVHRPEASRLVMVLDAQSSAAELTWWGSAGERAVRASSHTEAFLGDMIGEHGVDCIGTHGASAQRVKNSETLELLKTRLVRLTKLFEEVLFQLAIEDTRIVPASSMIFDMLDPYLEKHARRLDPVGSVLETLGDSDRVIRYGLDTAELVRDRRELTTERWQLRSEWLVRGGMLSADEKKTREVFESEFGDFRDGFVLPVEESLAELRRIKIRLRRDGATTEARVLGDFLGQLRLVLDQVLEVAKVVNYEEQLSAERRGLRKKERNRMKAALRGVAASYTRLVTSKLADSAVESTILRMQDSVERCIVVVDPTKGSGIVRGFLKAASDDVGLIVVERHSID